MAKPSTLHEPTNFERKNSGAALDKGIEPLGQPTPLFASVCPPHPGRKHAFRPAPCRLRGGTMRRPWKRRYNAGQSGWEVTEAPGPATPIPLPIFGAERAKITQGAQG